MRLITDVLREFRRGRVVDHASEELARVVRGVMETGKAGSLTLKIFVKPPKTRGDNALILTAAVNASEPQPDMPEAIFFASEAGDLLREDPTNQRLFAEVAHDPATGEIRSEAHVQR